MNITGNDIVSKDLIKRLNKIQQDLKAPKDQYNSFSKFSYRSCEGILEAVKPLLGDDLVILIGDEVIQKGDRYYVRATATLTDGEARISNTAEAREALSQTGMQESQLTGATSSYARKYALNGLLAIDDAKDADTMDNTTKEAPKKTQTTPEKTITKGEACPKCGKPLMYKTTTTGRNMWKCTGSIWRDGKEMGCDFVQWENGDNDRNPNDYK